MRTNMQMCVRSATELDLDRVAEVIARTNQLNATGLRLDRADVVERLNGDRHFLGVVELKDNFGDFGTVGVLIAEQEREPGTSKCWRSAAGRWTERLRSRPSTSF